MYKYISYIVLLCFTPQSFLSEDIGTSFEDTSYNIRDKEWHLPLGNGRERHCASALIQNTVVREVHRSFVDSPKHLLGFLYLNWSYCLYTFLHKSCSLINLVTESCFLLFLKISNPLGH